MKNSTPHIIFLKEADSTNKEIWQLADSGQPIPEGLILWAGKQQAGRGMGTTKWHSEAGKNLTCSFFFKPVFLEPGKQFILNKCIAISICSTLQQIAPEYEFRIKWPNDIYHENKKISGTLIENRIQGQTFECCVVGIGININQIHFPEDVPNPISLALITGKQIHVKTCLFKLNKNICYFYTILKQGDHNKINELYLKQMLGYSRYITFRKNDKVFDATIEGVSDYGKLILRDDRNNIREYGMKEIEFLL